MVKRAALSGALPASNGMAFFSSPKIRKAVCAILVLAIVMPTAFLMPAKKTEAILGVPVGDWFNTAFHALTSVSSFLNQGKEFGLDQIAWMISSAVLKQITADLVDWINGGFEGNPTFIDQPEYFFLDLADQIAGDFIFKNEDLRFLCDPLGMGIDIRGALSISHFSSFRYKSSCRLSQIFGNIQNARLFLRGEFRVGGWTGWLSLTQIPGNNIFGATNLSFNEMLMETANKKSGENKQLGWGNGFFPTRDQEGYSKTPGVFIESQLEGAFGQNLSKLGLADELNEILNALMSQLLNKTLQGGLLSLSTRSSTQNNPYSARLRTGDPAAPFRRLTSEERSGYKALSDTDASESQQAFDQLYAQADTNALNRIGGGTTIPNPKASLANVFTHQRYTCTDQYGGNGASSLAIDGSQSTYSKTGCIEEGYKANNDWWEMILANPIIVEEIRIDALSSEAGLTYAYCNLCIGNPTTCGFTSGFCPAGFPPEFRGGIPNSTGEPIMEYDFIDAVGASATAFVGLGRGSLAQSGNYTVTNAQTKFNTPISLKRMRIVGLGASESNYGVNLREVTLYNHLAPIFDLTKFPTTVDAFASLNFQPVNPGWVTVYYFPRWDINPVPQLTAAELATNVTVSVRDSNGQYCQGEVIPPTGNQTPSPYCDKTDATPTYNLEPGYSFVAEFVATEPRTDGFVSKSLPVVKQFTVPPLQNITNP